MNMNIKSNSVIVVAETISGHTYRLCLLINSEVDKNKERLRLKAQTVLAKQFNDHDDIVNFEIE